VIDLNERAYSFKILLNRMLFAGLFNAEWAQTNQTVVFSTKHWDTV
jgi:hypothetical protein